MSRAPVFWRLGSVAPPSGAHVAVVPGAQAPLLPLDLPDGLRGIARERVAQRQLVEQLSTRADAFEMLPYLPKGAKRWSRVLVADAGQAIAWRKALGRGCKGMVPDYLSLPSAPGLWVIQVEGGVVTARTGLDDGFSAEIELGRAMLAETAAPKAVLRLGEADAALDDELAGHGVPILRDAGALKKAGFAPMRWADASGGIDLKAPPSAAYDRLRETIGRWRVPVLFGVLAVAAWMGSVVLETRDLSKRAAAVQSDTMAMVREHFVPSGPILDIRAQVSAGAPEQEVEIEPADIVPNGLTLFGQAAPVLTREDVQLQSVSFRGETGLVVTVVAPDFAALDRMIADLEQEFAIVEQLDSRARSSGGVVSQLGLEQ